MNQKSLLCLALALVTIVVYWRVSGYDFIGLDDPSYVYENSHVSSGLTRANIYWAFTSTDLNWHPLTWLSHMVDVQLFGLSPAPHHLVNLLFHVLNTLLLFLLLSRMTDACWKSAFVAALFALHPMHVESVAWVAERKDLLSTSFWFLALLAYVRYASKPAIGQYLLVLFLFVLGLMTKPMLVTLPFVMLLFDYWPLNRTGMARNHMGGTADTLNTPAVASFPVWRLLVEKLPFLLLSVCSCVITLVAQRQAGAVATIKALPLSLRMGNGLVSYVKYVGKMFWPVDLTIIYPLKDVGSAAVMGAGAAIGIVSWGVFRWGKKYPYLPVGWLMFLVTLVPVIGFVQVGEQAMAERYTYIPYFGLFLMITWGVAELVGRLPRRRALLGAAAAMAITMAAAATSQRLGDWRNSVTMFSRAVEVVDDYYITHNLLGLALEEQGRAGEAISHFRTAIRLRPSFAIAHYNLGLALALQGDEVNALAGFGDAIKYEPDYADAYFNRALLYEHSGQRDKAIADLEHLLRLPFRQGETNHCSREEVRAVLVRIYKGDKEKADLFPRK